MKRLIIENTYRSLLIYILIDPKWKMRDYELIKGRISEDFIIRFKEKVNKTKVRERFPTFFFKNLISSLIMRIAFINKVKSYDVIYGNVFMLRLRNVGAKLIQLDDGLMTFNQVTGRYSESISYFKFRNNLLFRKLFNFDFRNDFTKYLYIVPESYKLNENSCNCKFINIERLINNLSDEFYIEVCNLFGFDGKSFVKGNILMLQPFYEDGLVSSLEYEIAMYKKILNDESIKESDLYIKPHPRSSVDYTQYFLHAEFISKDFPYELLIRSSGSTKKFKKIVSIHSSGIEEFNAISDEVISFGTGDFDELDYYPMKRYKANP